MKRCARTVSLVLALVAAGAASSSFAFIINPCFVPELRFHPANPSMKDTVQVTALGLPYGWFSAADIAASYGPDARLLSRFDFLSANEIVIDVVLTRDPGRYDGYRSVPEPLDTPFATLPPLSTGTYSVWLFLRSDFLEGPLYSYCAMHEAQTLTVRTWSPATSKRAVIEYYNAALDHCFVTQNAKEMADLHSGIHPGWTRTGESFAAYERNASDGRGATVVRLYGLPQFNLDTHFYTASLAELYRLYATGHGDEWLVESSDVFEIALPDFETGECGEATTPVYRLWNARSDSNHRYVTSGEVRQAMIERGWVAEGYGAKGVVMCAP